MFPEGLDAFDPGQGARFHRGMAALWERMGVDCIPLVPGAIVTRATGLVEVPGHVVGRSDGSTLVVTAYRDVTLRLGPPVSPPEPYDVETATARIESAVRGLMAGCPAPPALS